MKILFLTFLMTLLMTSTAYAETPVAGISVSLENADGYIPQTEIDALYRIVEAEATGYDIESKKNIASVIYNRTLHSDFPSTIKDVIFQSQQFSPIADGRYFTVEITDETIQAVDEVLQNGTTTEALYFCNFNNVSGKMKRWFRKLEYLFTDEANHSFYK